ncbi:MAG: nucleoside hydrolase [Eubacteriales bacterium]|nr:nucleoside hydrolase [Eubacteriales bacterium]
MSQKIPVILDIDTGSDDAVALITALKAPELEVKWIATTWGNVPLAEATENSLRVLDLARSAGLLAAEIELYAGAERPLARDLHEGRRRRDRYSGLIDGEEVYMHPPILPGRPYTQQAEAQFAPFKYIDYLSSATEPQTIIATGPLTNLAIALSLEPNIVSKIKELIVMGGGYQKANVTPYAEANFWNDPEAVACVLHSGLKPLLVPLDATHEAYLRESEYREIFANSGELGEFCCALLEQRQKLHDLNQPLAEPQAVTLHDVLAVCAAFAPQLLSDCLEVHCQICLSAQANGHLVIDRRENPAEANARFAYHADRAAFVATLTRLFQA